MRSLTATALLLSAALPLLYAQEPEPAAAPPPPATHQEAAAQLIDLLKATDACLAGCTDAASVQAALPRLKELAHQAQMFIEMQDRLPEPTTQDYIAAQELLEAFNTTWQSIRDHIDRLRENHLLTPELSDILRIAPEE